MCDVILRIRRVVVSIYNARHDTYCIMVGRGEEHHHETKIEDVNNMIYSHSNQQTTLHPTRRHQLSYSAYYQLDFRGDLTASRNLLEKGTTQYYCVLLPMLRNDFKPSSNSNRGGG